MLWAQELVTYRTGESDPSQSNIEGGAALELMGPQGVSGGTFGCVSAGRGGGVGTKPCNLAALLAVGGVNRLLAIPEDLEQAFLR